MRPICFALFIVGLLAAAPLHAQVAPDMAATGPAAGPSVIITLRGAGPHEMADPLATVAALLRSTEPGRGEPAPTSSHFGGGLEDVPSVPVPLADGIVATLSFGPPASGAWNLRLTLPQPGGQALLDAAAKRLVTALVEQPALSEEEREKRTKEVVERISLAHDQMNLLQAMAKNNVTIGPEILKERIKAAELEKQRLEMELAALRVRGDVIAQEVERITREVGKAQSNDEVLARLREIVPLRQQEVERTQKMIERGVAAREELLGVEEKVVQARIRVAEREEAIRQGTKATLLERLNDELATVMINRAEMETRLAMIRDQQPSVDLAAIGEAKLQHLTEQYRPLFRNPGALPPLYGELEKKLSALKREYLALRVTDVTVTPGAKAP